MAGFGRDKQWIAGGLVGAVAIAAGSYFLVISPQFDARAEAEEQLANEQMQNTVLHKRLATLREQFGNSGELESELAELQAAVPPGHDVQGFTRQLTAFAEAAEVTILSISPGAPTMIAKPTPAPAPTPAADGDSGEASPAEEAPAPSAPAPTGPAGNLYSVPVTIVTTGDMAAQRAFLGALEREGSRRALVTDVAFNPIQPEPVAVTSATAQQPPNTAATDATGGTDAPAGTDGSAGSSTDPAAATASPTMSTPPAPSAKQGQWTMTTQLLIFVAPQSPGDEAQLESELGTSN